MKRNIFKFTLPENAIVVIGIIFGILFIIITPPFQVPDEYNHFYRSFQVSELRVVAEVHQHTTGGFLPESLVTTARKVSDGIPAHPEIKQNIEDIFSVLDLPLESSSRVFVDFSNTSLYSPIPYLPQAIGIALGRIIGMSPILLMYMGRSLNLFTWIFLIYLSIKTSPFFKWSLFLLALSPMSLFLASSLSADAVTNGLSFLLISVFLNYAFEQKKMINKVDIFIIFFISILLALSKLVYFPLVFLFLLIPVKKLGGRKKYFTIFTLLVLISVAAFVLWWLLSIKDKAQIPPIPNVSLREQLLFILTNPLNYIQIVLKTIAVYGYTKTEEFIGKLGWLDTHLPRFHFQLYLFMLVIVSFVSKQKNIIMAFQQRIIILTTLLLNAMFIITILYLACTPVAWNTVECLQGRYFIPLSPLLFLLFYNSKINLNISKLSIFIIAYSIFSLSLTASVLLQRYYL